MPYPKIKFIVDRRKDLSNCLNFMRWHQADRPEYLKFFLPISLHYLLKPGVTALKKQQVVSEYTKCYYAAYQPEIKIHVSQIEKSWLKVAPEYFQLMHKIFKGHAWPAGNYRGIASIFNMFPRYVQYKIFFFPPDVTNKDRANKIISHEMTHFIFFDYLRKKYKLTETSKIKGKQDNYVWLVSEIFNYTLEGWKPYSKIMKNAARRQPYFGEINLCRQMQRDWQKNPDIDRLLDKWLK